MTRCTESSEAEEGRFRKLKSLAELSDGRNTEALLRGLGLTEESKTVNSAAMKKGELD